MSTFLMRQLLRIFLRLWMRREISRQLQPRPSPLHWTMARKLCRIRTLFLIFWVLHKSQSSYAKLLEISTRGRVSRLLSSTIDPWTGFSATLIRFTIITHQIMTSFGITSLFSRIMDRSGPLDPLMTFPSFHLSVSSSELRMYSVRFAGLCRTITSPNLLADKTRSFSCKFPIPAPPPILSSMRFPKMVGPQRGRWNMRHQRTVGSTPGTSYRMITSTVMAGRELWDSKSLERRLPTCQRSPMSSAHLSWRASRRFYRQPRVGRIFSSSTV
mmetsp:Transcript_4613/g.11851  ORF Transcript_4613/g.11851 Transcript_4613/m.11851 type:complete len:271 (+) Transcript_4613:2094-2906(+)